MCPKIKKMIQISDKNVVDGLDWIMDSNELRQNLVKTLSLG